uniref:Uncharacterized protein n=1 Tax=Cannabis sativa TaxID=3483 RepID=A0A803PR47_CANSA
MTDKELHEFVIFTLKSIELHINQFFDAQKKQIHAMFEPYCPSTEALLDSSSQPNSPEVDDYTDAPVESVRSEMDLGDREEALNITVGVSHPRWQQSTTKL